MAVKTALPSVQAYYDRREMPALDGPGMPPPGPSFLARAQLLGDGSEYEVKKRKGSRGRLPKCEPKYVVGIHLARLYGKALRSPRFKLNVELRKGQTASVNFVPGHIWGQHMDAYQAYAHDPLAEPPPDVDGPHPAEVMVVGKMPWEEESSAGRNLLGASGAVLVDCLKRLAFKQIDKWYVTNLVKFMPPTGSTDLKKSWVKDCLPLLQLELRIVRPKYILVLGADAAKALLGPDVRVGTAEGIVFPIKYSCVDDDGEIREHTAKAMVVLHPAQVAREEPLKRQLERGLARFRQLVDGVDVEAPEDDIEHLVINTWKEAKALIARVTREMREAGETMVAWDAEWHGRNPWQRKNAYLRTIQFSWAHKKAVCFVIHDSQGKCCFLDDEKKPAIKRLARRLTRFMRGKRACGHFFTADMEWLVAFGLDLRPNYEVPVLDSSTRPAFMRWYDGEGGADIAAMAHAVEETGLLGLESLTARYTTAPPYSKEVEDFIKKYCKQNKLPRAKLGGYGPIPDEVLCPYGNYDADVTRRLWVTLHERLVPDFQGNCCVEAAWDGMLAFNAIADMRQNGVLIDQKRMDFLTDAFVAKRSDLLASMRAKYHWPEFNPRSVEQARELLFGEALNGTSDEEGRRRRLRPESALSLGLTPITDTGKPPKQWAQIVDQGLEDQSNPSTGKAVLSILINEEQDEQTKKHVELLRDFRFVDQVSKSVLRPPELEKDGFTLQDDGDGNPVYERGLAACIDNDGRVRSFLAPTAETGRWKSSSPNLQNISKNRDDDYRRLLGAAYDHTLRSMFVAAPGNVLIEADYKGAELLGAAIMAGDEKMLEHVTRNLLDESDASYYDIHSSIAVLAFRLKCAPTKKGLESIGRKKLRNIAKTVVFGVMYGRGAKAICLAAREQGVNISVEEAQVIIDTIFRLYPRLEGFFAECQARAIEERWLCSAFGRFRRFAVASDDRTVGEFGRQAMNFPIQSMIASALNRGLAWLRYGLRVNGWNDVKLLLSIHDAVLLECPPHRVPGLCDKKEGLIKWAMCDQVPIHPTHLNGDPKEGVKPIRLGVEIEVCQHWSEPVKLKQAKRIGLDPQYAHAT